MDYGGSVGEEEIHEDSTSNVDMTSEGEESDMVSVTVIKPAKKKHTGENALRRFFPDNFSALHRTQGVLYGFQNAEEARSAGLLSTELVKLKRSVLQWASIPPVIAKGLGSLPPNFIAIGCCAAGAVLNRVDPDRAFVVIRTTQSGKGQWNIIALYDPPNTVISERHKLNLEVVDVYKKEQAAKKLLPRKNKAKETDSPSSRPLKDYKKAQQKRSDLKMKRVQDDISMIPTKQPSPSLPVSMAPITQGSPNVAFLAPLPNAGRPAIVSSGSPGFMTSAASSSNTVFMDNNGVGVNGSGSGSRGAGGSTTANSGLGSTDSMGFSDSMGELPIPKLTVSTAPPLQREIANPLYDPLHARCSPPLGQQQHVDVPAPSPSLVTESSPRAMFSFEAPVKSSSPTLFGTSSPGTAFISTGVAPMMTDGIPYVTGLPDMGQFSSGNFSGGSSPRNIVPQGCMAIPTTNAAATIGISGVPASSPSFGILAPTLINKQNSPVGSASSLEFWVPPHYVNSPLQQQQLPQSQRLVFNRSSPGSPGSPSSMVDGTGSPGLGRKRPMPLSSLSVAPLAINATFSAPSSPTKPTPSPRQTLYERYRSVAENCWNMRFGDVESCRWEAFRAFVCMDKLTADSALVDQLVEFFCERHDPTTALRIRWVMFVLLFHTQAWVLDPRPYLALQEAVRYMQQEAFHGVQVRSIADSRLRNSVQNKACYLFRTSDSSCGFMVLSRKHKSIRGDTFWHTLYGHHRPGENVLLSTLGGRLNSSQEVILEAPNEIQSDFFYDPSNPLGSRFQSLRAIVEAKSAQEGFQYAPVMFASGYLSDSDASSTSDVN